MGGDARNGALRLDDPSRCARLRRAPTLCGAAYLR